MAYTKKHLGRSKLPQGVNIGFYSGKYQKKFRSFDSFKKYDTMMKRIWAASKFSGNKGKNYLTPSLRKAVDSYNKKDYEGAIDSYINHQRQHMGRQGYDRKLGPYTRWQK